MGTWKKAGAAIIISDKVIFKIRLIRRGKEFHHILVKETITQEALTYIVVKYQHTQLHKIKTNGCESQVKPSMIIMWDFNTPFS